MQILIKDLKLHDPEFNFRERESGNQSLNVSSEIKSYYTNKNQPEDDNSEPIVINTIARKSIGKVRARRMNLSFGSPAKNANLSFGSPEYDSKE